MKILIIAHQYWPTPGPATLRLTALIDELLNGGHSVDVITSSTPSFQKPGRGPSGEIIYPVRGEKSSGTSARRVIELVEFATNAFFRSLRVGRHDIVITDPPPTAALASWAVSKIKGSRFVYYLCDSWAGSMSESASFLATATRPLVERLENATLKRSDLTIAVTSAMERVARSAGASKVCKVANGADIELFSMAGPRWARPRRISDSFFLYAGNYGVVHGAGIFVQAARALWDEGYEFDLVYMGYGSDHSVVEMAPSSPRLHLLERQDPRTVAAAFRGAIGALSSLRPIEAYADARPVKSITGMAAGCPPIYAGSGDFADELQRNCLGYVASWEVDQVSMMMRRALKESELAPDDHQALRRRCTDYAREHWDQRKTSMALRHRLEEL